MKVKSESEVAQSCLTLSGPMDCSLAGSSVHGIFQARVLEWGAINFPWSIVQTQTSQNQTRNTNKWTRLEMRKERGMYMPHIKVFQLFSNLVLVSNMGVRNTLTYSFPLCS